MLNFIIRFNDAVTSKLAIMAALDLNLVANLGLRKHSLSFICSLQQYAGELSRVGV